MRCAPTGLLPRLDGQSFRPLLTSFPALPGPLGEVSNSDQYELPVLREGAWRYSSALGPADALATVLTAVAFRGRPAPLLLFAPTSRLGQGEPNAIVKGEGPSYSFDFVSSGQEAV